MKPNKLFHLLVVMGASMTGATSVAACSGGGGDNTSSSGGSSGIDQDAARDAAADVEYAKISPCCGNISDYDKISPATPIDSGSSDAGDGGDAG